MDVKLSWDETKRQINLRKHGLDAGEHAPAGVFQGLSQRGSSLQASKALTF
jgi:uncharacterized DUF497 family protein